MPDKLVTKEAEDQAMILLREAASIMHSAGWSWLSLANELKKQLDNEDVIMGRPA